MSYVLAAVAFVVVCLFLYVMAQRDNTPAEQSGRGHIPNRGLIVLLIPLIWIVSNTPPSRSFYDWIEGLIEAKIGELQVVSKSETGQIPVVKVNWDVPSNKVYFDYSSSGRAVVYSTEQDAATEEWINNKFLAGGVVTVDPAVDKLAYFTQTTTKQADGTYAESQLIEVDKPAP